MISNLWHLPFLIQAVLIFIDEFYFHHKRGLPKWERIGHPLDTLTILVALVWVCFSSLDPLNLKIYIVLALFSLFFITKDEFVHKDICPKLEMWLHALLFINHPILLTAAYFLWKTGQMSFLVTQCCLVGAFLSYQILYWNVLWKKRHLV